MMAPMVPITRLYADADGHARFEDIEIPLVPEDPPPDAMSVSQPWPEALDKIAGTKQMDATAILDYFKPLDAWLDEQIKGKPVGW